MIVIGLDVHKQSVTAVAVDEAGRPLDEKVIAVGSEELLGWASTLDSERLWAVEDCRQLTPWLEQKLLSVGEDLVCGCRRSERCRNGVLAGRGVSRTRSTRWRSLGRRSGSRT